MALKIEPVKNRRQFREFVKLPWSLYHGESRWIAPLVSERRRFLDRKKNPFFEHAEAEYFLARRNGVPVGRITAHIDHAYDDLHGGSDGMFGFFECEDSQETASALFDAAESWLAERGRDRVLGPMNFTSNDECGLLVDGFDEPPVILLEWHHPYYTALIEERGYTKAMDLWMWRGHADRRDGVLPIITELAEKLEPEHGITVRPMNKRRFDSELQTFMKIYNFAWEQNWGFVPLTDAELVDRARQLKPVLDPRWVLVAERKDTGETVGIALALPDFNQVLCHLNGRLLPFGWLKALYFKRKIDHVRFLALGVLPEYRHTGIAAAFYMRSWDTSVRLGWRGGDLGWTLETNTAINRGMESMGAVRTSTYRIYERSLNAVPTGSGVD